LRDREVRSAGRTFGGDGVEHHVAVRDEVADVVNGSGAELSPSRVYDPEKAFSHGGSRLA
jgi:hypothetical protein